MPKTLTEQQPAYWTHPCRRTDWSQPLMVFGGLFVTAMVLCGTIEARGPVGQMDDIQVLNNENVIGPVEIDPAPVECGDKAADSSTDAITVSHSVCKERSPRPLIH